MILMRSRKNLYSTLLWVSAVLVFATPVHAAKPDLAGKTVTVDQNKDGKIDHWEVYDSRGVRSLIASDTNADGQPDSWKHPIRGMLILREKDRNYDGRVDDRMVTDFIYDKTLKLHRHLPLWKELDEDYDGVIDAYRVRGEQNPIPDRCGQAIDPSHWSEAKEAAIVKAEEEASVKKSMESDNVLQMNARQAIQS